MARIGNPEMAQSYMHACSNILFRMQRTGQDKRTHSADVNGHLTFEGSVHEDPSLTMGD